MRSRILKETIMALAVICAVAFVFVWLMAPADAAQRGERKSKSITEAVESDSVAMPRRVDIDEQVLIRLTNDLAELSTRLENVQRKVDNVQAVGIFRRPKEPAPDSDNPTAPKTPTAPPQFEFPSEGGSSEVGLKDWTPEQWQGFIEKIVGFITMLIGLFGGGAAGGLFAKNKNPA